jgi:hypothetical protein
VDWLWDYWTAPGFADEEHLAEVKRMLALPGALEATLGYYRAMFDPARADPDLAEVRQAAGRYPMTTSCPINSPCHDPARLMIPNGPSSLDSWPGTAG